MSTPSRTATAADVAGLTTFAFPFRTLADGTLVTFTCRRLNLLTQLLEDVVNAPLLTAAMEIIKDVQDWITEEAGTVESAFLQLQPQQKHTIMEQLRRFACAAIIEPTFVMGAPANEHETNVAVLEADTLFALWNYANPDQQAPRLSEVAARTFRDGADANVPAALSDVEGVRSAAVDVAAATAPTCDA